MTSAKPHKTAKNSHFSYFVVSYTYQPHPCCQLVAYRNILENEKKYLFRKKEITVCSPAVSVTLPRRVLSVFKHSSCQEIDGKYSRRKSLLTLATLGFDRELPLILSANSYIY